MTPQEFWIQVDVEGPWHPKLKTRCWLWTGRRTPKTWGHDYGAVRWDGRNQNAHRVAWELFYGSKVPRELQACHACDNPPCVRPDHIWIGTQHQNNLDKSAKGRNKRIHDYGPLANGRMDYAPKDDG